MRDLGKEKKCVAVGCKRVHASVQVPQASAHYCSSGLQHSERGAGEAPGTLPQPTALHWPPPPIPAVDTFTLSGEAALTSSPSKETE